MRAHFFLGLIAVLVFICSLFVFHGKQSIVAWKGGDVVAIRQVVKQLTLTDLALWSEARYTRNPALTDFFTPFQDNPASFEHFPAGSIISPKIPAVQTSVKVNPSI